MAPSCRMPVNQDLSEVHTEQSTRHGKTLSKLMSSGLVASCSVLVLGFTNDMHLLVTDYTFASGI